MTLAAARMGSSPSSRKSRTAKRACALRGATGVRPARRARAAVRATMTRSDSRRRRTRARPGRAGGAASTTRPSPQPRSSTRSSRARARARARSPSCPRGSSTSGTSRARSTGIESSARRSRSAEVRERGVGVGGEVLRVARPVAGARARRAHAGGGGAGARRATAAASRARARPQRPRRARGEPPLGVAVAVIDETRFGGIVELHDDGVVLGARRAPAAAAAAADKSIASRFGVREPWRHTVVESASPSVARAEALGDLRDARRRHGQFESCLRAPRWRRSSRVPSWPSSPLRAASRRTARRGGGRARSSCRADTVTAFPA